MSDNFISGKEKLTFREIVLEHVRKILEISRGEFMGGYKKTVPHGSLILTEYVPDSRQCYIQSVESLVDILFPFFDDKMTKDYEELIKKVNDLAKDLYKKRDKRLDRVWEFERKKMKAEGKSEGSYGWPTDIELEGEKREGISKGGPEAKDLALKKLSLMRQIFRKLNLLMNRKGYLKSSVYVEEIKELEKEEDDS